MITPSPHSDGLSTDDIDILVVSWYRELLGGPSRALDLHRNPKKVDCIQDNSD